MTCTLVLSAYNGANYLEDQLNSIMSQSLVFDEVIIADDCSTDSTASFIENYISSRDLPNWSLQRNAFNKGWKQSFHDLILEATGDYVFPCDQDDVWELNKVEIMVDIMLNRPEIDVLACGIAPFYEKGAKHNRVADVEAAGDPIDAVRIEPLSGRALYIQRPGCSYCIRKTFINQIKDYWNPLWPHDAIIWRLAAAKGSLALLDKRLVSFRRHGDNASERKRVDRNQRLSDIEYYIDNIQLMIQFARDIGCLDEKNARFLVEARDWCRVRHELVSGRNRIKNCAIAE